MPCGMLIFTHVGFSWVMPRPIVDLFVCWRGIFGSTHKVAVWKTMPS